MRRIKSRRIKKCRGFKRLYFKAHVALPKDHGVNYIEFRDRCSDLDILCDKIVDISEYDYDYDLAYKSSTDEYRKLRDEIDEIYPKIKSIEDSRPIVFNQFLRDLVNRRYIVRNKPISGPGYYTDNGESFPFYELKCLVSIQDKSGQYYKFIDDNLKYELVKTDGPTVTDLVSHRFEFSIRNNYQWLNR